MENITQPKEAELNKSILSDEDVAPQVICLDADGKAEGVKLEL